MEIIPAIDLVDGKCVRLTRGSYGTKKVYNSNPLKVALSFQKAGIKKLHLVDLDGAKEGIVKNWKTIEKIARSTTLKLQAGGGFHTEKDVQRLLRFGSHEVALGTLAIENPQKLKKILQKFGKEKIVADVGIRKGNVYIHGWKKKSRKNLYSIFSMLSLLGIETVICTDIEKDGALRGPNFSLYKTLVRQFPKLRIIASGGIHNIEDLKKLSKIGVAGAVIGKAIYEKTIALKDLKPFL